MIVVTEISSSSSSSAFSSFDDKKKITGDGNVRCLICYRKALQPIWDRAVRFIEANESRVRLETEVIQGEEFDV